MAYVNKPSEISPQCEKKKKHHWHKSDRQPSTTTIRRWMVCCNCGVSCEVMGKREEDDCGRYNPEPKIEWPDPNEAIYGKSKPKSKPDPKDSKDSKDKKSDKRSDGDE